MAFTVEDGTGLENSNAYISVSEFQSYWDDRGFDYSGYTTTQQQIAIIKATDYIDGRYRYRFIGQITDSDQALAFPRNFLYDELGNVVEGIPNRLKYATAEYAKRALSAELVLDPEVDATDYKVVRKREKVGPIEEETQYDQNSFIRIYHDYPSADYYLKDYLIKGDRLVRD